ncbi:MAG TPA: type II toxin-antitoxin system Phd/YefM family antitoxin [Thermoanaerobaculia bacterium]
MTISVTELKARLFEIVRQVEREEIAIEVERHGRVVARIIPAGPQPVAERPWETLRGTGVLLALPGDSVLEDRDFEATR